MNALIAILALGAAFYFYKETQANASIVNSGGILPDDAASNVTTKADIKTVAYNAILRNNTGGYFNPQLIMGQIQTESGFNPTAIGAAGEIGLMQIKPSTAADFGYDPNSLYDPATNVEAGMQYLFWCRDYLIKALKREPTMLQIFSAYNGGVGNASRGFLALSYYTKIQANSAIV